VRDVLVLGAVFGVLWLGYSLSIVTVPMLIALALAYLFEPLVAWATRRRFASRGGAAAIIILLAGVLIIGPAVVGLTFGVAQGVKQVQEIRGKIDQVVRSVKNPTDETLKPADEGPWLSIRNYVVDLHAREAQLAANASDPANAKPVKSLSPLDEGTLWIEGNWAEVSKKLLTTSGTDALTAIARWLQSAGVIVFMGFLTAFFFFFFCTGWGKVLAFWENLIPEQRKAKSFDLISKMDAVISGFVRGRLTICGILILYYTLAFWIIGVPAPLILGPVVGVLALLPFVSSLGVPTAALLLWLDSPGSGLHAHWAWIIFAPTVVYMIAQAMDDYVLTPAIQGKNTGMDTPSILFASLAGGTLAGVYGLLLAIPIAACIKILLREVFWPRFDAWAKGRARDFLPIGRE
jgi:predicted PurR-regulated permease PerM